MHQPSTDRYFAEILASAAKFADIVSTHDPDLPVPTCPDWTLRQLATHSDECTGGLPRSSAPGPPSASLLIPCRTASIRPEPADRAAWLDAGADRVIAAVEAAGSEPVWAFGRLAPANFWARRQAQETMMHRVDAELAVGRDVVLDPGLAADGIDEWLTMATGRRGDGTQALPAGAVLHLQATAAPGAEAAAEWLIRSTDGGLVLHRGPDDAETGEADVSVSGPADRLLRTLVRRLPADDPAIAVRGDAALLTGWLAGTPF